MQDNNVPFASTIVRQTSETLKLAIENGSFKPGSKLPAQRKLESMLGVSRSAVREAVKVLEGMGLVYSVRGSGTYVVENIPMDFSSDDDETVRYSLREIAAIATEILSFSTKIIARQEDQTKILLLQEKNCEMIKKYSSLHQHQKFLYESSMGATLVRLSGNALAYDLYMKVLKPVLYLDNILVVNEDDYMVILKIDQKLIESIIEGNGERACFWGRERERELEKILDQNAVDLNKKYEIL